MKRFVKRLKSEQGLTLIELIASLTVFSLVIGTIYSITMFGFRSYHQISIENSLRDEADIIMSSIITEMYAFGPESIRYVDSADKAKGILLERADKEQRVIQIVDRALQIQKMILEDRSLADADGVGLPIDPLIDPKIVISSDLAGSEISVECGGISPCTSGLLEINLVLDQEFRDSGLQLELKSKFGF